MQLFGTSGIRRIADDHLLELAVQVGLAVGKTCGSVVVGGDTRSSSDALKQAFISGVLSAGAECSDAGVVPTPTLALAAREFQAGAVITASHNPPEYNGIKLLNRDGSAFDSEQQRQIEDMILGGTLSAVPRDEVRSSRIHSGAIERHIEHIVRHFPEELKVKVALDCGCGAASVITPRVLRRLGCEVVALNCYPSGLFPRGIEPIEDNLGDLMRITKESGAALGIAHDGDGDRMMAVDDRGRFIAGDKLLAIFAQQEGAKQVVTTIDASMIIDDMDFNVTRTKVGDTCVSEELKKGGDFGGEPSGSWVFPGSSLCPDGIYAAARLAAIASQQQLSGLVDGIPEYPLVRGSLASDGVVASDLQRRLLAMEPVSVSTTDGTKLNFEDGWLLVRSSGTEPKIRVTAEARSQARAQQLYDSGLRAIKECLKEGRE